MNYLVKGSRVGIFTVLALSFVMPQVSFGQQGFYYNPSGLTAIIGSGAVANPAANSGTGIMAQTLRVGDEGEAVKNLQEILKTDPSIYPQGIVSGYYGKLTEEALKRLQQKANIPATGVLDDTTRKIVWPDTSRLQITVLSPNGGETWNRNEAQTVTWKTSSLSEGSILEKMTTAPGKTQNQRIDANGVLPYFRNVTIELVRDSDAAITNSLYKGGSLIAYRLGTADLSLGQATVKIPPTAPEAKDYRVRITVGSSPYLLKCGGNVDSSGNILCPNTYPASSVSDTSDGNIAVLGAPSNDTQSVRQQISALEKLINELTAELQRLKGSVLR